QCFENSKTVESRHHEIEQDHIELEGARKLERAHAIVRQFDGIAFDLEIVPQAEREIDIVFRNEETRHDAAAPLVDRAGSSISIRVPRDHASSTRADPPWSSTRSRTIDNPTPVPAMFDRRASEPRQNRFQI